MDIVKPTAAATAAAAINVAIEAGKTPAAVQYGGGDGCQGRIRAADISGTSSSRPSASADHRARQFNVPQVLAALSCKRISGG